MIVPKKQKRIFDHRDSNATSGGLKIESADLSSEFVYLQHNRLSDMSFLEGFKAAVEVDLSGNQFKVPCRFDSLTSLQTLKLAHNQLTVAPNLLATQTRHLDLSHNKLTILEGTSPLKQLRTLNASNNAISKINEHSLQSPVNSKARRIGPLPKLPQRYFKTEFRSVFKFNRN